MAKPIKVREDTGRYVIEEHDGDLVGECRFALDRRDAFLSGDTIRTNIGWYRTYRGALNALSRDCGSAEQFQAEMRRSTGAGVA